MNDIDNKDIGKSILDALDRVQSRNLGLMYGYLLVLKTINSVNGGNEDLKPYLSELDSNLEKVGLDTK